MFAIIISEKGGGDRKEVFEKSEINVGRVQGNDLMLPKGNVSKHHARLLFRDGRFIVTDLKSTNGTYVNGRKIAQATIVREGDKIYIGDFVLRLDGIGSETSGPLPDAISEETQDRLKPGEHAAAPPPNGGPEGAPAPPPLPKAAQPGIAAVPPALPIGSRGAPGVASHHPPDHASDDDVLRVPAAPRLPHGLQGLHAVPAATQTSPPRAPLPGGTMPIAPTHPPRGKPSMVPEGAAPLPQAPLPPPIRAAAPARPTPEQAARRLALVTLVDRVAEAIDLSPLKSSPFANEGLSQAVDRAVHEQAKTMLAEGEAPDGVDADLLVRDALRELLELGPVGPLLGDHEVTEIHCFRPDQILVRRGGLLQLADASFTSEDALARVIARLAAQTGEACRHGELVVERRLADGSRMIAIAPPESSAYALTIRKAKRIETSLEDFVRAGALSRAMATFLESCLSARANILVCAASSSSAAAFVAALASTGPAGDRVAVVQELDEIGIAASHVVSFRPTDLARRGEESVRAAAHMRPDRLIVATLAGHLGPATIEVIADGTEGVIAAIGAPSLRQALPKLVTQLVFVRPGLHVEAAREAVSEAFDIAIELGRLADGRPRVTRLAEVGGTDDRGVIARDAFTFVTEGGGTDGVFGVSGVIPRVVGDFAARGVTVDPNIFKRVGRS